jgi:hypothetical protein
LTPPPPNVTLPHMPELPDIEVYLVAGEAALAAFDPGGLEVLEADLAAFQAALTSATAFPAR